MVGVVLTNTSDPWVHPNRSFLISVDQGSFCRQIGNPPRRSIQDLRQATHVLDTEKQMVAGQQTLALPVVTVVCVIKRDLKCGFRAPNSVGSNWLPQTPLIH